MPGRELTEALIEVVKTRMAEQGISGAVAADRSGIPQPTLSRKLRGIGDFTVDELEALAVALGEPNFDALVMEARKSL